MAFRFTGSLWRSMGAGSLLLLGGHGVAAQAKPATYDFLTVTVLESTVKATSKLLLSPAFNGRTEVQLEGIGSLSTAQNLERLRHNTEVVNQNLGELSAAGWEVVEVHTVPFAAERDVTTTRYLLHRLSR